MPIAWRRLTLALLAALVAVGVITPIAGALGLAERKAARLALQLGFLLSVALFGRTRPLLEEAGLTGCGRPWRTWIIGFGVGAGSLIFLMACLTALGEREVDADPRVASLLWAAVRYVPLAFVIGILEDVLFFGFLYTIFGRHAWIPVLVYAATHFIHIDRHHAFEFPVALRGFEALGEMGVSMTRIAARPMEFVGLAIVGATLCMLRIGTGSVWAAMGVHGGWYWARTVGRKVSEDLPGSAEWLFGTDRFYDGVLGQVTLLVGGIAIVVVTRGRRGTRSTPAQER